jgi:hypothetical protein
MEDIMTKPDMRKRWMRRLSACLLASLIPLAGLPYGWGRSDLPMDERANSAGAAQIEKGSALAVEIEHREKIRVLTASGEKIVVRPVILAEGVVSSNPVSGYDRSTVIPWSDVRTIRVRKNAAGLGALIGAGAGALLLLAISQAPEMDGNAATALLYGGLLGLVPGTVLGSMITSWKTVYTAPATRRPLPRVSLTPTRRGGMMINVSLSF